MTRLADAWDLETQEVARYKPFMRNYPFLRRLVSHLTSIVLMVSVVVLNWNFAEASVLTPRGDKKFSAEFEGQTVWQGRNQVAVPGDTGTRFSLREILQSAEIAYRLELSYALSERSQLRAVYAPLTLDDSGTFSAPLNFQGQTFASGVPTQASYKFNSYRLTYRYRFIENDQWSLQGGLTAKIRDAHIRLRQGALFEEKVNVGFVPLVHGAVAYQIAPQWQAELEFDALAAPQGRAEDVRLGLRHSFFDSGASAAAGVRLLEGGADNDTVYTFSFFQYAFLAVGYTF
jgi:hypothetical protein